MVVVVVVAVIREGIVGVTTGAAVVDGVFVSLIKIVPPVPKILVSFFGTNSNKVPSGSLHDMSHIFFLE